MAVKEYRKGTSYTGPSDSEEAFTQETQYESGVGTTCSRLPGIPNFINDFTIVTSVNGKTGDVSIDRDNTYTYNQTVASSVWFIRHDLKRYPSVTVVDSAGSVVIGDVDYRTNDIIVITFCGSFSGTAYLN